MKAASQEAAMAEKLGEIIPLAQPFLNEREGELIMQVLQSGRLSLGPMLTRFEEMFAQFIGTKHAVACSSGTAGLHVAAITAGWKAGDEVITSPFSFIASANVIRYVGAKVVFADVDADTFNIDASAVEHAITPETRGLLPVHIFGYPANLDALNKLAANHDLTIVEDACEALGATHNGMMIGAGGNPAVFAFYANKQMTTGEGGMLVTDDESQANMWRRLINQGRSDSGQWLTHDLLGYNYRLSDIASAIGVAQLEKITRILAMRTNVAAQYDRMFRRVSGVTTPFSGNDTRSWFVYTVLLDESISRDAVIDRLNSRGVQCKPYLPCIHLQPAYRELGFTEGMYPVAESISRRALALPFFPTLSPSQQEKVVAEVTAAVTDLG